MPDAARRDESDGTTSTFGVAPTLRQPAADLGPRARKTIAKILDATRQVFLTKGYAGTTIDEVASVAGISRGSVYTYFPSKRDMLLALGAGTADDVEAVFERFRNQPGARRIGDFRAFVDEYWTVLDTHGAFSLAWTQAAFQDDEIRAAGRARHLAMCRALGDLMGGPGSSGDPTARGLMLSALVERTWSYAQLYAGGVDEEALRDELARTMFVQVHGRAPGTRRGRLRAGD